jgi:hypothetical protein
MGLSSLSAAFSFAVPSLTVRACYPDGSCVDATTHIAELRGRQVPVGGDVVKDELRYGVDHAVALYSEFRALACHRVDQVHPGSSVEITDIRFAAEIPDAQLAVVVSTGLPHADSREFLQPRKQSLRENADRERWSASNQPRLTTGRPGHGSSRDGM